MASTADTVVEWTTPAKVEEFRSALGTKLDPAIFPSDDRTLKRYLVARKGDIAEASKMILRSQQWRQDDCVPYGYPSRPVPLDSIRACLNTKAAYIHGVDRDKRPIVWVKGKLHDGNLDRSAVQKWIIHLLDEVVTRCHTTGFAPQFTGVIDAGDMGWSNLDKGALNFLLLMLSANMPELLGRIYILNPGFIFKALWTIVTPFLDARTSKKIFFLGSGDSMKADLAKQIDEDNLLVEYGGKCTYVFNPDTDIEASYLMYRKDGKGGFKMTRDPPADGTTDDLLSPARTPGGAAAGAGAAP